jgi:hypothetical protein
MAIGNFQQAAQQAVQYLTVGAAALGAVFVMATDARAQQSKKVDLLAGDTSKPTATATMNGAAKAPTKAIKPSVEMTKIIIEETGKPIIVPVIDARTPNGNEYDAGMSAAASISQRDGFMIVKLHSDSPIVLKEVLGAVRGYMIPAQNNGLKIAILRADGNPTTIDLVDTRGLVVYSLGRISSDGNVGMSSAIANALDAAYTAPRLAAGSPRQER